MDDEIHYPSKIKVCTCEQCKFVKSKRTKSSFRKYLKRLLNKKRRKIYNKIINFYYA